MILWTNGEIWILWTEVIKNITWKTLKRILSARLVAYNEQGSTINSEYFLEGNKSKTWKKVSMPVYLFSGYSEEIISFCSQYGKSSYICSEFLDYARSYIKLDKINESRCRFQTSS